MRLDGGCPMTGSGEVGGSDAYHGPDDLLPPESLVTHRKVPTRQLRHKRRWFGMLGAMTDAPVLTDLDRALTATEEVVAGIRDDQWAAPTPCTELDVRGVLNHLVRGNLLFVAVIRDEPRPEPGTDHLGDDPLAAFRGAAGRLREAFGAPGALDAVYAAPFGSGPGAVLAQVRVVEILAHGWDLARATGQPAMFPDHVAERALRGREPGVRSPSGRKAPGLRSPPRSRSRRTRPLRTGSPDSSAARCDTGSSLS